MTSFMKEFEHLKIKLEEIRNATNSFGNQVIGKGGFGAVYKGEVSHSKGRSIVAIKRLDRQFGQGDPEFLKEIMMLSRYRHQNLISLLGYCDEDGEKILVYEYAANGSLDQRLSDPGLTWTQRLKICIGAAKGLSFLHVPNGTYQRVIHCDIKSANILLDESLDAKVADFGLAKLGPANQQYSFLFTNARGTPGYCDPQYMMTYTLTKESDIYSFGVVLFEVMCGRLCFECRDQLVVFVRKWKQSYTEMKLKEIIFQDLMQQIDPTSLEIFSDIAFQCLQPSREERPTMSFVLKKLELALEYQVAGPGLSVALESPVRLETNNDGGGGNYPMCQVVDCNKDLSAAKAYYRLHKVCEVHSKAAALPVKQMQRFCQQCSRFHPLSEFDEKKRSCRRRLADHNRRTRKTQPETFVTGSESVSSYDPSQVEIGDLQNN